LLTLFLSVFSIFDKFTRLNTQSGYQEACPMLITRCCKVDWNSSGCSWRTRGWRVCELDDENKICDEQTENLRTQFTQQSLLKPRGRGRSQSYEAKAEADFWGLRPRPRPKIIMKKYQ